MVSPLGVILIKSGLIWGPLIQSPKSVNFCPKYSITDLECQVLWMNVCLRVCVPSSTDLGWRCLGWQRWPHGLDSPTEPPGFQPELAWPGSALSWSSVPGTRGHQVRSSRWLAARRTPHAGGGKMCRQQDIQAAHQTEEKLFFSQYADLTHLLSGHNKIAQ